MGLSINIGTGPLHALMHSEAHAHAQAHPRAAPLSSLQADGEYYLGFVNREADEPSKRSVKYRGAKDGKPDTRVTAYFKALVSESGGEGEALPTLLVVTQLVFV